MRILYNLIYCQFIYGYCPMYLFTLDLHNLLAFLISKRRVASCHHDGNYPLPKKLTQVCVY